MYLPWWTPITWAGFVASVAADKASGGAVLLEVERAHAAEIDRQFKFSERPDRLHPERFASHEEYLRRA